MADLILLLAFIAVTVVCAEAVRMTCRRQLSTIAVQRRPAAAEATIRATDGS